MSAKKRDAFIQRRFYTQKLLHIDTFTHRLSHRDVFHADTDAFSHAHFYTQTLLHTRIVLHRDTFTHKGLYTQKPLHADTFTDRHFYTQPFYIQTRLHAEAFTSRHFSTQSFLHTDSCTHRRSYRQNMLQTGAFTGRRFCKTYQHEMMLWNCSETSWLRSANLSAKHSAGRIPPKKTDQKPRPVPNWRKSHLRNWRLHDHAFTRTKMRSYVIKFDHTNKCRWTLSIFWTAGRTNESSHVCHEQSLQTNNSWLLI